MNCLPDGAVALLVGSLANFLIGRLYFAALDALSALRALFSEAVSVLTLSILALTPCSFVMWVLDANFAAP